MLLQSYFTIMQTKTKKQVKPRRWWRSDHLNRIRRKLQVIVDIVTFYYYFLQYLCFQTFD